MLRPNLALGKHSSRADPSNRNPGLAPASRAISPLVPATLVNAPSSLSVGEEMRASALATLPGATPGSTRPPTPDAEAGSQQLDEEMDWMVAASASQLEAEHACCILSGGHGQPSACACEPASLPLTGLAVDGGLASAYGGGFMATQSDSLACGIGVPCAFRTCHWSRVQYVTGRAVQPCTPDAHAPRMHTTGVPAVSLASAQVAAATRIEQPRGLSLALSGSRVSHSRLHDHCVEAFAVVIEPGRN